MSNPTWNDDYLPEATCSDCGSETIIKFTIKPSHPKCDGFCDSCGCVWIEGIESITPMRPSFRPEYQPVLPWGAPKVISVKPIVELTLVHSKKNDSFLMKEDLNIFPEDYCECKECGYDHKYDAEAATRKHKAL